MDRRKLDGAGARLAEPVDRAEGLGEQRRGGLADVADAERIDEAVELRLAPRVDVGEELVETFVRPLLGRQHLLAFAAGRLLARPRLLLAALVDGRFDLRAIVFEAEDIGRGLEHALGEEELDLLGPQALDVHGAARETKCLSCSTACAAQISSPVQRRRASSLPVFSLISRTAGEPQTGQTVREDIRLRALRPLLEDDLDDLRDDVAGPLDDHGVADADVDAVADRLAEAVEALDVVLVVERDVDHRHAAHRYRIEPPDRRQRAGAADLDVDLAQHRRRLFGREFVGDGPARLAGDVPQRRCRSSRSSL